MHKPIDFYENGNIKSISVLNGILVAQKIEFSIDGNILRRDFYENGKLRSQQTYSGTTTGGGPVYVESDGDLLRYTSSRKYKTDIETIEDTTTIEIADVTETEIVEPEVTETFEISLSTNMGENPN